MSMLYLFLLLSCNQSTDLDFFVDNHPKDPREPSNDNQEQQNIDSGINSDNIDAGTVPDTDPEEIRELCEVGNVSLKRIFLENAEERQAVCNDGSYKQGSSKNKDKWIVWFQGGALKIPKRALQIDIVRWLY